ncbi:hypothetical protein OURE66S_02589 [Oligella ureolytica]
MEPDFLDYKYYPTLRTRHAELSGLKHLAFSAKRKNSTHTYTRRMAAFKGR